MKNPKVELVVDLAGEAPGFDACMAKYPDASKRELWILAQEILKGELARQKGLNIELGNLNQELVDTLKEREQQIIGLSSQRH
jgi:hypothetical protein